MRAKLWRWLLGSVLAVTVAAPPVVADFKYEIAPIFARHGCAAADCHGGATGRGGFKLSLFATEPRADYEAITRDLGGRRIDFRLAKDSLLLKKPTRSMKHGGGEVFDESSAAYRQLLNWIESGVPYESADQIGAELDSVSLSITDAQLTVSASFSSGTKRDVSELAMFESTNPSVAQVDETGRVTQHGPGKAWLLARFSGQTARLRMNIPFKGDEVGEIVSNDHALDKAWAHSLDEQNLKPAPAALPHVLARRIFFDLAGRPPRPDELGAFLSLPPTERAKATAERLVNEEAFVDSILPYVEEWFVQPTRDRNRTRVGEALRNHEPLSNLVADLFRPGLALSGDPRDQAEFVGAQLLGISIGCARCHNHPHDRWTQAEHLKFSAFFRTRREHGKLVNEPFFVPGEGHRPVQPALLPLGSIKLPSDVPPDELLTAFIIDGGHDYFSRNIANRLFAVLLGNPLVDSPDDHRLSNPPAQEAVLDALATQLKESDYDLRLLVRFIVTSQLYAIASNPPEASSQTGDPKLKYFARREARPLSRKQFESALSSVIGFDFSNGTHPRGEQMMETNPSPSVLSPLADQLAVLNSGAIQRGLAHKGNEVETIFTFSSNAEQALTDLYLLAFSRTPRPDEVHRLLPVARKALSDPQERDDLATALLLSREFGSIR